SALVVQNDGKIVVAGGATRIVSGNFEFDFALVRYNQNGSLDQTFGSGGKGTPDFGSGESAKAVVLQNDGKIVVGGNTGNSDFALARYLSNGSLDQTFGSGGKVTTNVGAIDTISRIALQTDGRIVVGGNIQ